MGKRKRQASSDLPVAKKGHVTPLKVRFRHPARIIVAGPSGCGKTVLMSTMLDSNNHAAFFDSPIVQIVWCFTAWQKAYDKLKNQGVIFHQGIPEKGFDSLFTKTAPEDKTNILVLDDLMREAAGSKQILDIFSTHSHHSNVITFYLTQNIYHQGAHSVDITRIMFLALQNMLPLRRILGTFLDKKDINWAMQQIYQKTEGRLFSHLLIDLHPLTTSINHRMRLNITNNVMETIQIL